MLIFLDFDDVLFNTKKFKDAYFSLFKKRGVSRDIFDKFYYTPSDSGIDRYCPVNHVKRICKELNLNYSDFKDDVLEFVGDTSRYIFGDSVSFLNNFSKNELYLVSFSKTDFQKSKIFNSGIANHFCKIKIVNELKGDAINEIIKNNKIKYNQKNYFIDDRVEHLTDAKIKNPNLTTIFLLRKEGRYKDRKNKYCDYKVSNFNEILKIIKQKNVKKIS
ncbi:MAG: hypothetical protein UR60_C0015G0015 [Candidatus Moranbacteria bacterium GW2011_GWF2_34_56]|nr:MAG: hypothetical protein UR51_C0003G0015 [Candidatus Moranbacteria bacterium GW2011_GWF1_34_10]KKP64790.1 MAG: hypothetical protein UR60_C0015G0015 [Candidatus Moranbacteria bacterium GW2011_GWF2_34_56]HBI16856.1 hypothetical protein [Candidatus Moranbacteria bacterium]